MLHSISWARFGATIFIALVIYYAYVLLRYYWRDIMSRVREKKEADHEVAKSMGPDKKEIAQVVESDKKEVAQPKLFAEVHTEETPELFKVTQKLVALLRQMVSEAAATGARREELEDRIRMLLSGYRQLIGTPYQVSVNNFLQRTCTTTFSLLLSDEEIAELWVG